MFTREMNRRRFLKRAGQSAIGMTAGVRMVSASDTLKAPRKSRKYVIGVMGAGTRGMWLLENELTRRPDVAVDYVCDADANRAAKAAKLVEQRQGKSVKVVSDFRRILDDKSVDVLFNLTPDHWHALPTILACQAGKDVYVEKPASHNIWEGRKMVEAARKYKRIVQLGTQNRSAPYAQRAVEYIRSGKLGDVHYVRVLNMRKRKSIGKKRDAPCPAGVDYDLWLGSAPSRPFNPNRFHYCWHWFWDYSGGDIINDGVHQVDLARWLIGKDYPTSVSSGGGKHFFDDDQETPDTQVVTWEYPGLTMTFELALWTPYMKKAEWDFRDTDGFPDWPFSATKIEVYGTKGIMLMGRHGGGWQVFDNDDKVIASDPGRHPHGPHLDNFFACIESRATPNADIAEGHRSTILCHLGNISYRCGGQKLRFDAKSESFIDAPAANKLVKRIARSPWAIPDNV